jgi:hypothetical protein
MVGGWHVSKPGGRWVDLGAAGMTNWAKVLVSVLFHARKTLAEEQDGSASLLRLGFARQVLSRPLDHIDSFAWIMAADGDIAGQALAGPAGLTDDIIFQRVGVTWNFLVQPLSNN